MAKSKLKLYEITAEDNAGRTVHSRDVRFHSIAEARGYNIGYYEHNPKVAMIVIHQLTDDGKLNRKGYSGTIMINRRNGVFVWMPTGNHYTGKIYTINPNTGQLGRRTHHGIDY